MNATTSLEAYNKAVDDLRALMAKVRKRPDFEANVNARDGVLARYQPLFALDHLPHLTEEEFRSFLYFENNRHWTGLYRQAGHITKDMDALRKALSVLQDENRPLADRFDSVVGRLKGFGKALASGILLVMYPERYGVWNSTSESALKMLGIWPQFDRGTTLGKKYAELNDLFCAIGKELGIDLWTLDWLWWELVRAEETAPKGGEDISAKQELGQGFRLERHLHDFLITNWEKTELGRDWSIYTEPGDEMAGAEYPTGVGRIDILARHKRRPAWLVVELKRDRAADYTVGQVLRYMGWIKRHLAETDDDIKALIIAPDVDENLMYALQAMDTAKIRLMRYRVDFHLEALPTVWENRR